MRHTEIQILIMQSVAPVMYESHNGGLKLTANVGGEDITAAGPYNRNGQSVTKHVDEAFYYKHQNIIDEIIYRRNSGNSEDTDI
jgi:hypothetical protein